MTTDYRVLIVDTQDRLREIADTVKDVVGEEQLDVYTRVKASDVGKWIVILHRNDVFALSGDDHQEIGFSNRLERFTEAKTIINQADVVIAYTGGHGGLVTAHLRNEAKVCGCPNANQWFGINRGVDRSDYDDEGIREVVRWAVSIDRDSNPLPRLLSSQRMLEHVWAHSLLCQGYLVNYALKNHLVGVNSDSDVGQALLHLGLARKIDEDATAGDLGMTKEMNLFASIWKGQEISNDFWLSPFRVGNDEEPKETVARIRSDLDRELGGSWKLDAKELAEFVENLESASISDELVARAYSSLSSNLS